jgi:glycosyltransferase involved in cell wall biosynthesis
MQLQLYKQRVKKSINLVWNRISPKNVYYIIEGGNWSIDHDGRSITNSLQGVTSTVTTTCRGIRKSIIHFGSIHTFWAKGRLTIPHESNKVVVTWFHVSPKKTPAELPPRAIKLVDLWHTSCSLTKDKLIKLGMPKEKIVTIPLGVNLRAFSNSSETQRQSARSKLGIPAGKIVVGSFQKDGNGWGEGLEPKLIKGPDIFCDVVEQLAKQYDLFVLLTGPARGYVKRRLEKAAIPYLHRFLNDPDEVAQYYKALDLYIVTGRQEGGPKAVVESLASGVPLVSTKVGMAPDVINDGEDGFLCDVDNVDEITEKSLRILEDKRQREKIVAKGLATVRQYDWCCIAQQYENYLYRPLL